MLQLFIQERFGISMCRTGILRMLYRMGFRAAQVINW
ncbi:winged helix-turn-helix domain-containing protein [Aneurinibacillus migulanus]